MPSWMGIAVLVVAGLFLARVTRARGCGGTGGFGRAALLIGGLVLGGILLSGHWSSRRDEARERAIAAADHERNVRFGYQRPSGDFGNIGVEEMKQYRAQVARRARLAAHTGDVAEAAEPETAAQPAPPQPKAPPAAPTPPAPATPQTPSKKVKFDAGPIKVEIDTDEESGMPSGDELTRAATSIVARATVEAVKHFTRASGEAAKRTAKELASAGSSGAKSGGTTASASSADAARVAESVSSASHDAASPTAHAAAADSASSAVASSASKRPSWLDESLGKQGAVYRTKVVVGPYKTRPGMRPEVAEELIESARAVIDRHIGGSNRIPNQRHCFRTCRLRASFKEELEEKKESETAASRRNDCISTCCWNSTTDRGANFHACSTSAKSRSASPWSASARAG